MKYSSISKLFKEKGKRTKDKGKKIKFKDCLNSKVRF